MNYRAVSMLAAVVPLAFLRPVGAQVASQIPGTAAPNTSEGAIYPPIVPIPPPKQDFFAKQLDFHGIPIMASRVVADDALYAGYDRLALEMKNLPGVIENLAVAGAQLQIIGKDQVTSDLPDYQDQKGKPIPEYHGLTIDQRTRGFGGLHTSCGEENLLKLDKDRYRGRDICLHEFAHCIQNHGIQRSLRERFTDQYHRSLAKGLWVGSYAGSNTDEFFAELTMWYFGTHGDLAMKGEKPANGPEGLKKYDPEAYAFFDDFYGGRIPIERLGPSH